MLSRSKPVVLFFIALIGVLAVIGQRINSFARSPQAEPASFSSTNASTITIAPYDIYEDCLTLNPKEILHYSFKSSAQSYFNIHYHNEQDDAFYPVPDYLSSNTTAQFSPEREAYYCLMWTNPTKETVELSVYQQLQR